MFKNDRKASLYRQATNRSSSSSSYGNIHVVNEIRSRLTRSYIIGTGTYASALCDYDSSGYITIRIELDSNYSISNRGDANYYLSNFLDESVNIAKSVIRNNPEYSSVIAGIKTSCPKF